MHGGCLQGAAHFLEHALFLGSTTFPQDDEVDSYLSHFAGESNGFTEAERIVLHADVSAEGLGGALARLAAAVTCPLLPRAAVRREVCCHTVEISYPGWRPRAPSRRRHVSGAAEGCRAPRGVFSAIGDERRGTMADPYAITQPA